MEFLRHNLNITLLAQHNAAAADNSDYDDVSVLETLRMAFGGSRV